MINMNTYTIGNNLELLKNYEDNSIDMIYFDPPYNTGRNFYNFDDKFETKEAYINFIKLRLIEVNRILKKTGSVIINIEQKI